MNGDLPKKKRGRPPKVSSEVTTPLGSTTDFTSELDAGHKLLNEVMNMNKIKFLLDKPDVLLFGLYDYYETIDQPMWLSEVFRKFNNKEYSRFGEITGDIKLVLENSCRFWGRGHKFIKQALRVEKVMSRHVKELPEQVKSEGLHDSESTSELTFKTEDFHSEILEEVEKRRWKKTLRVPVDSLLAWEAETFESKMNEIRVIPELAEIGQFLSLAKDTLCLKPISQYEIERMLLLCHESITLANVMTSLLCPTALRTILYNKPVMVYEVWSSLLRKKMDTWYHAYAKCNDQLQMFQRYGIEMSFWNSLGPVNPFVNQPEFDEMPLHKKSVILKALCDVMFHSNKKLEESFNAMDENKLRRTMSFEDSKYKFYSMFSPEIRVYRVPKNEDEMTLVKHSRSHEKNTAFYLVAWNKKSLTELIKGLSKKKKSLSTMHKLQLENEGEDATLLALQGMRNQWEKTKNNENFIESSINYWLARTRPSSKQTQEPPEITLDSNGIVDILNDIGVRRYSKRKSYFIDSEDSTSNGPSGTRRSFRRVKRLPGFFTDRLERLKLRPDIAQQQFDHQRDLTTSQRGRKRRLSTWLSHLSPSIHPHRKVIDILRAAVERDQSPQVTDSDNVLTVSISSSYKSSDDSNDPLSTLTTLSPQIDELHPPTRTVQRTGFNVGVSSPARVLHIPVVENANDLFEGSTPGDSTDILCIDTLHASSINFREIQVSD